MVGRVNCVVANCKSTKSKCSEIIFYNFPKKRSDLYLDWVKLCGCGERAWTASQNQQCSFFADVDKTPSGNRLVKNAVPSLNLSLKTETRQLSIGKKIKCIVRNCNHRQGDPKYKFFAISQKMIQQFFKLGLKHAICLRLKELNQKYLYVANILLIMSLTV